MNDRIQTVCLLIITTVTLGAALFWLRSVMIPFVLAVLIAVGLSAIVELQMRHLKVPSWAALLVTFVLSIGLFAGIGWMISISVAQLAENAPLYNQKLTELIARITAQLPGGAASPAAMWSEIPTSSIGNLLMRTSNAILDLMSKSLLVLLFVVFLMLGRNFERTNPVWDEIEDRIQGYLWTKATVSIFTGVLVGTTLALLGVDLALVFGLFAFLLNFVPSIGSLVATLLPLPVVLVSDQISSGAAVLAIAIPGIVQFGIGNVIEPKIMGDSLDLHPVSILLSLIIWGTLWGIVGMLLAVPLTAVLKILLARLDATRPVADVLAGRLPGSARA